MKDWNLYSEDQVSGLICSAFIFKEQLWMQLPNKINALEESTKSAAVATFKELLIKNSFAEDVAYWFCAHI
jgi:hypothetical protein